MFADELLRAQQAHLFRLFVWAGVSVAIGVLVLAGVWRRRASSSLLWQFALQLLAWGAVEAALTAFAWGSLTTPDLAAATRADRLTWMRLGLELGTLGVGILFWIGGWVKRYPGVMGAGVAVLLHGAVLLALDARLAAAIAR